MLNLKENEAIFADKTSPVYHTLVNEFVFNLATYLPNVNKASFTDEYEEVHP